MHLYGFISVGQEFGQINVTKSRTIFQKVLNLNPPPPQKNKQKTLHAGAQQSKAQAKLCMLAGRYTLRLIYLERGLVLFYGHKLRPAELNLGLSSAILCLILLDD